MSAYRLSRAAFWVSVIGTLFATTIAAPSSSHVPTAAATDLGAAPTDVPTILQTLQRASDQFDAGKLKDADAALTAIIGSPAFGSLSADHQHRALQLAGQVAYQLGKKDIAYSLFLRSSSMPEATAYDWRMRFFGAIDAERSDDAVASLTRLARQSPSELDRIRDWPIWRTIGYAKREPGSDAWFELLDALHDAHWTSSIGLPPDGDWRDLALLLLERGQKHRAEVIANHLKNPYVLISLHADNRFAGILAQRPDWYDVSRGADEMISRLRQRVDSLPRSMEAVLYLDYALLHEHRDSEVLALTDATLRRQRETPRNHPAFDDAADQLVWIMDNRARALGHLNRWDEAIAQRIESSKDPHDGHVETGTTINLGEAYCALGKPELAMKAVAPVTDLSPYGRMRLELVHYTAALESGDPSAQSASLAFLRDHRVDAQGALLEALIRGDQLDEAATLLISLLNDPKERTETLVDVQTYTDTSLPPRMSGWHQSWRRLIARPDVKQAIGKVGTIGAYRLASPVD